MAIQMGKALAFTAVGGLVAGIAGCAGEQAKTDAPAGGTAEPAATPAGAKACCKGQNECEAKGRCAVEGKNGCAGQNKCKGQGGCNKGCPPAEAGTAAPTAAPSAAPAP